MRCDPSRRNIYGKPLQLYVSWPLCGGRKVEVGIAVPSCFRISEILGCSPHIAWTDWKPGKPSPDLEDACMAQPGAFFAEFENGICEQIEPTDFIERKRLRREV